MSDQAITRRLRQADQLRELSLSLIKAKKSSDEDARQNKTLVEKEKKTLAPNS